MSKNKRRKNRERDELSFLADSLNLHGRPEFEGLLPEDLPPPALDSDGTKKRGPAEPSTIRQKGDPELSAVLAEAISYSGKVDRATHRFHTYPAGMHPDCARRLIELFPGKVHDPFCGGGTVLVEGILAGRAVSGSDLSPVAELVAHARTAPKTLATPLRSASRKIAAQAQLRIDVEVPEGVEQWYEPHVAQEIGRIVKEIAEYEPEVQPLLKAVLSSILVKSSFRESDTSNRRVPNHRPPGTTATLFHKKARELGRALESLPESYSAEIRYGDARMLAPKEVDWIITSPPYPGVYDYLPMQQLRYLWLDLQTTDRMHREIGARRSFRAQGRGEALKEWRVDTTAWIHKQASGLNPGGHMAIVVGDGLVGGKLVDALFPTTEAMQAAGIEVIARASADRPDHARNAIRTEHLVLGRKIAESVH